MLFWCTCWNDLGGQSPQRMTQDYSFWWPGAVTPCLSGYCWMVSNESFSSEREIRCDRWSWAAVWKNASFDTPPMALDCPWSPYFSTVIWQYDKLSEQLILIGSSSVCVCGSTYVWSTSCLWKDQIYRTKRFTFHWYSVHWWSFETGY